jgi:hypothetical protein
VVVALFCFSLLFRRQVSMDSLMFLPRLPNIRLELRLSPLRDCIFTWCMCAHFFSSAWFMSRAEVVVVVVVATCNVSTHPTKTIVQQFRCIVKPNIKPDVHDVVSHQRRCRIASKYHLSHPRWTNRHTDKCNHKTNHHRAR